MKSKSALKWIINNSKSVVIQLVLLTLISALTAVCLVGFTYFSKQVVDIATKSSYGNFLNNIICLIFLIVLELILHVVYSRLSIKISGKLEMNIKTNVFNKLLKKDISAIYNYHTGDLLNRITGDTLVITNSFVNIVPLLVSLVTRLTGAFIMLFWLDKYFALIYLVCGPLFFLTTQIYSKKMKSLHKKCQETDGKVKSYIQEALSNILVIKAFKTENAISKETLDIQKVNYNYKLKRNTISIVANIFVYIAFTFGYYFALGWGAYKLSLNLISVGTLTAMLQLVSQVQTPLKGLSGIIPQYFHAIASSERIMEIEDLKEDEISFSDEYINSFKDEIKSIVFSSVNFKYDDRNTVIEDFSYEIGVGEFVAISGISGIGKSTLLKLLLGVIKPLTGEIYFLLKNGEKVYINEKTRGLFSYVPQGNMVLSGSIEDNIRFFNDSVSEDEIKRVCKISKVDDFLCDLPDGLKTIVGEKGVGLSEGQIQRVAIARALISDAQFLLLDEATSALDEQTEKDFLCEVKKLHSKTCIIISHKQAAFDICDKTIKF